jgi:DNA-binding NtrC family response regulator
MASPTPGKHVFVVDDEPVIASTVATILRLNGFTATPFTNPIQALNAARLEFPDLLISDVVMAEMSGFELAMRIQKECPACRVLLFSGQASTADLLWNAHARSGQFEVLLKPVHPDELLSKIRSLAEVGRNSTPILPWPASGIGPEGLPAY